MERRDHFQQFYISSIAISITIYQMNTPPPPLENHCRQCWPLDIHQFYHLSSSMKEGNFQYLVELGEEEGD